MMCALPQSFWLHKSDSPLSSFLPPSRPRLGGSRKMGLGAEASDAWLPLPRNPDASCDSRKIGFACWLLAVGRVSLLPGIRT